METTEKTCFKCKKTLPISDFYKHSQMKDGHLNKCKECTKKDMYNDRHFNRRKEILAFDRERANQPHRKEAKAEIYKKWKEQNPERRAAQTKLGSALRSKKIEQLPCFICGEKAEAHHPDYSRPLDVVWLCSAHHKQAHALVNRAA